MLVKSSAPFLGDGTGKTNQMNRPEQAVSKAHNSKCQQHGRAAVKAGELRVRTITGKAFFLGANWVSKEECPCPCWEHLDL